MARRIRHLILLSLLFILPGIRAQDTEEPRVSLDFHGYQIGPGNFSELRYFTQGDESAPVELGRYTQGPTHEYRGPRQLVLFKETPAPTEENPDAIQRTPLGAVSIPEGMRNGILLVRQSPRADRAYDLWLVDADARHFPNNSLLVFNGTGVRLVGKVGKTQAYFQPGPATPIDLTRYQDKGIPAAFLVETEEGPKFVFEKALEYALNRRVILLLEPPRRKGSLRIQVTNLIEVMDEALDTEE